MPVRRLPAQSASVGLHAQAANVGRPAPSAAANPVLWLLRHGKAESPVGVADEDRRLTPRGERQASTAGERLREHAPNLTVVLTSPRLRARRTAELAVRAHGDPQAPVIFDELGDDYRAAELLAWIDPWLKGSGAAGASGHIVVVGHNPTLAEITHQLTGDARGLSTGTLVGVDLTDRRLLHYLPGSKDS